MSLEGMPVFTERHGPLIHDLESSPFQIFTDLFPDEIMNLLVSKTNRYSTWKMDQLEGRNNLPASARARHWVDLTLPGLKAFLATLILMGLPLEAIMSCTGPLHPCLNGPSSDRSCPVTDSWTSLVSFMHATTVCEMMINCTKLVLYFPYCCRHGKVYYPDWEICLDESMIAFKGRAPWRVY